MKKPISAVVIAAATALAAASLAVAGTVTVAPGHMDGWAVDNDVCSPSVVTTGSVDFVNGPGTPPAGSGSVRFTVGSDGNSYPTVRQSDYNGTKLSDLTAFDYWTYVSHTGSGGQAAYIDLYVDNNGDGVRDDILAFEPVYQTSQGAVVLNTWQHWDAQNGLWWSDSMGGPPPWFTLASYIADHPNARIVNVGGGGIILAAGCGGTAWTNFVGNADKLTIGVNGSNTTYDFEAAAPAQPTAKSQCKKGGWKNFTNPSFKNQGQCVSFVNHHNGKGKDDVNAGKKHGKKK